MNDSAKFSFLKDFLTLIVWLKISLWIRFSHFLSIFRSWLTIFDLRTRVMGLHFRYIDFNCVRDPQRLRCLTDLLKKIGNYWSCAHKCRSLFGQNHTSSKWKKKFFRLYRENYERIWNCWNFLFICKWGHF